MSQEKMIVNYVLENPNCTWRQVKQKFGGAARKEVFETAKKELHKRAQENKQRNIINTLKEIWECKDPWYSLQEFQSACIQEGISERVHGRTIKRAFARLENTRKATYEIYK